MTTKPGKLYFTFFDEPRAPFELPAMKNRRDARLPPRERRPLDLARKDGRTSFTLPRPIFDPMATVVVVEFDGENVVR